MPDRRRVPAPERAFIVVACAAALAGVVSRLAAHGGLWLDEALGVNIARLPLGRIVGALRHDGHPPLSYVLLHGWIVLFGGGDVSVRAFSGVVAVISMPVAWWAGRRLGGPRLAWATLFVTALCPFLLRYATEARMYALVGLLALLAWIAVDAALAQPRPPRLAAVTAVVAALLWTHYWSIYLVVAGAALLLWEGRGRLDGAYRRVLIAGAVGVLLFVPWLPVFVDQLRNTGTPWGRTRSPVSVAAVTLNALGGAPDTNHGTRLFEGEVYGVLVVVLVIIAVLVGALTGPARRVASVAGATLGLGAVGCAVTGSAFASRYAAVAVPLLVLAAAVGLVQLRGAWFAATIAALALFGALFTYRNVDEPRSQLPALAAIVNARAKPGDLVLFCPDQLGPGGSRGLRSDLTALTYPLGSAPQLVDWRGYAARIRAADPEAFVARVDRAAGRHDIWLMASGGYRTFGDQCERLQAALAARHRAEVVQPSGVGHPLLEPATLVHFGGT